MTKTQCTMKKLLTTAILLVGTLTFAQNPHNHTKEEKRLMYELIQHQLDEGKITVESFGSLKGASPFVETRDFSIEKSEEQVIKDLQEVALNGERVSLHFIKRYVAFPWRGDTKYFITRVERGHTKEQ